MENEEESCQLKVNQPDFKQSQGQFNAMTLFAYSGETHNDLRQNESPQGNDNEFINNKFEEQIANSLFDDEPELIAPTHKRSGSSSTNESS